jgi:hypothetical protein
MADLNNKQVARERLQAALQKLRDAKCTCERPTLQDLRKLLGELPRHDIRNANCDREKAAQEVADTVEATGYDVIDLEIPP